MKSPKFPFSLEKIEACVNIHTIKAVWKSKILAQLRKQLLRDLVEYRDYDSRLDSISKGICLDIARAEYVPRTPRHYLVEKSRGLCRQMTIAAPRDLIVFQCLTNRIQSDIVRNQPTKKAYYQPGQAKFNKNKIHISPTEYGSIASWKRFQTAIFEFSKDREYIVVTDVANFYDFINLAHLRHIVSSICLVDESVLDFLIYLLEGISWRPDFMPRSNIGLPQMEAEAPRVLANAMLFELDRVADKHAFGDYVRFMDDIDVGVDSIPEAKAVVRDIDLTLQSRQLRLNSSKTKILSVAKKEAEHHFCIAENRFLDFCTRSIESPTGQRAPVRKALLKAYKIWRRSPRFTGSRFTTGNGDKIFKRIVVLFHHLDMVLPVNDAMWVVQNVPGLRETCLDDLSRHQSGNTAFHRLAALFHRGIFVDDAAYAHFADYVVHAKFTRTQRFRDEIRLLVEAFVRSNEYVKVYSAILIASKYFSASALLQVVIATTEVWTSDVWLGRMVGGLAPLMAREPLVDRDYTLVCQRANNSELDWVRDYHYKLRTDLGFVAKQYAYASAPNPTYPNALVYPKVLTILSISQNPAAKKQLANLKKAQRGLRNDPQIREWLR